MPSQKNNLKFSSLGFQMAITIGLGAWLGNYLDNRYENEKPIYTIIIILLSIAISFYNLIREVKKINKDNEKDQENDA